MSMGSKRDFITFDESNSALRRDLSVLRKSIETSVKGAGDLFKLLVYSTDEIKNYLLNDCEIVMECRVCRNLFRSIANFTIHKRCYCKDSFSKYQEQISEDKDKSILIVQEDISAHSEVIKEKKVNKLENVVNFLKRKKNFDCGSKDELKKTTGDDALVLESINSNKIAMYQTLLEKFDMTKIEAMEMHEMLERDVVVIGPDGKIISNDVFDQKFKNSRYFNCKKCNMKFITYKTYTFHIRSKHNENRYVYQCPDCRQSFTRPILVYRHMSKIHQKTTSQIQKVHKIVLKSRIQKKNLRVRKRRQVNSIVAESNEKAFLVDFENVRDMKRCESCGKRFERIAALKSHRQMCQKAASLLAHKNKMKKASVTATDTTSTTTSINNVTSIPSISPTNITSVTNTTTIPLHAIGTDMPALKRIEITTSRQESEKLTKKRRNTKKSQSQNNLPQLCRESTTPVPIAALSSTSPILTNSSITTITPIFDKSVPSVNNKSTAPPVLEHMSAVGGNKNDNFNINNDIPILVPIKPQVNHQKLLQNGNSPDSKSEAVSRMPSSAHNAVEKTKKKRAPRKHKEKTINNAVKANILELQKSNSESEKIPFDLQNIKKPLSNENMNVIYNVIFGENDVPKKSSHKKSTAKTITTTTSTTTTTISSPTATSTSTSTTFNNNQLHNSVSSSNSSNTSSTEETLGMISLFNEVEIDKDEDADLMADEPHCVFTNNNSDIIREIQRAEIESSMIQDNDEDDEFDEFSNYNNVLLDQIASNSHLYYESAKVHHLVNSMSVNNIEHDRIKTVTNSRPIRNRTTKFNSDFIYDDDLNNV